MLAELRKHAATSAALRKQAGLMGMAGKAVMGVGKRVAATALAHPMKSLTLGLGTAAAVGQAKRNTALFNPASQRLQLGIQP